MAEPFPAEIVELLDRVREVEIETAQPSRGPDATRRTVIWIVVDEGDVFVRSVRGTRGGWYRVLLRHPTATIHADGHAIRVRAVPAGDPDSIARTSAALERKYKRARSSLAAMVEPHTLPTTLRLEPA